MAYEKYKYNCDQCSILIVGQKAYDIIRRTNAAGGRGFCSHTCSTIYNNKNRKIIIKKDKPLSCIDCGEIKMASRNRLAKSFRCDDCLKIHVFKTNKINNAQHYQDNKIALSRIRKCRGCKIDLKYHNKDKFCSLNCKIDFILNKVKWKQYKVMCRFDFNFGKYPKEFDISLIGKHGWYSPYHNINGTSRDHIVSVKYGYDNKIDPAIIKHPANCQLMQQRNNGIKQDKCGITIDKLIEKIGVWDAKYS